MGSVETFVPARKLHLSEKRLCGAKAVFQNMRNTAFVLCNCGHIPCQVLTVTRNSLKVDRPSTCWAQEQISVCWVLSLLWCHCTLCWLDTSIVSAGRCAQISLVYQAVCFLGNRSYRVTPKTPLHSATYM